MSFIKDLCAQIDEAYINDPDRVFEVINGVINKVFDYQVSDYKCTKFYERMGLESKNEKGTFEDAAYTVISTLYSADEDISDDKFMNDVLDYFENRDGAKEFLNFLIDTLLDDVIEGEILSTLKFNPGKLFPAGSVTSPMGVMTDIFMNIIFRGNPSYENVIYSVLNLLPEKYSSIRNILNTVVMDEYMTQSQYDSIGYTIGRMLRSLVEDTNPAEKSDLDVTLVYDGPVEPEVTQDNMRLPSNIGTTFTGDASTERSINWYTKYSLKNSDIQIAEYSENPTFTDKLPKGVKVSTTSELVKREYPGVDLGIIGFISYGINVNRHTATITGLKPGTKYCYRIGDAKYGWWSGTGIIETADNSDSFTFFHVSDEQSQNAVQYGTWGKVVDTALKMFPEASSLPAQATRSITPSTSSSGSGSSMPLRTSRTPLSCPQRATTRRADICSTRTSSCPRQSIRTERAACSIPMITTTLTSSSSTPTTSARIRRSATISAWLKADARQATLSEDSRSPQGALFQRLAL